MRRFENMNRAAAMLMLIMVGVWSFAVVCVVDGQLLGSVRYYRGKERSLQHDGLLRWFIEYPPPQTSDQEGTVPILILLHFGTGNMRSSKRYGRRVEKDPWLKLAKQNGYLVLSPSGTAPLSGGGYDTKPFEANWNDYLGGDNNNVAEIDDVGFITALVEWAIQERNGDRSRVYIYGYSSGGTMTQRMIIERPNLFAAASAVSANLPERDVPLPTRGTPLFLMHGTEDVVVAYNGSAANVTINRVRSARATLEFFLVANQAGPNMMETTLPDLDPNDDCRVISQLYPSNTSTPVQYYILDGGGHNFLLPSGYGGPIIKILRRLSENTPVGNSCKDASNIQLAWDFMTQFTLAPS